MVAGGGSARTVPTVGSKSTSRKGTPGSVQPAPATAALHSAVAPHPSTAPQFSGELDSATADAAVASAAAAAEKAARKAKKREAKAAAAAVAATAAATASQSALAQTSLSFSPSPPVEPAVAPPLHTRALSLSEVVDAARQAHLQQQQQLEEKSAEPATHA